MDKEVDHIFVYGTLKTGGFLHEPKYILSSREDSINATMYSLNYFPAIKLNTGNLVHGELQKIKKGALLYMDYVEGSLFNRKVVTTNSGQRAYVYEWNGDDLTDEIKIWSGRW